MVFAYRWLFQKMHSELAASARTCVLGPNRPDVRNYKLCFKSQVKDFLCLQNVPSETRFQNLLLAILMVLLLFNYHSIIHSHLWPFSHFQDLSCYAGTLVPGPISFEKVPMENTRLETWQILHAGAPRVRGNSRLGRIYANRWESACFFLPPKKRPRPALL